MRLRYYVFYVLLKRKTAKYLEVECMHCLVWFVFYVGPTRDLQMEVSRQHK